MPRTRSLQKALFEVAKAVNSTLSVTETLNALVESATKATGAKACSLFLLSPDSKDLLRSAYYGLSEEYITKGPVKAERSIAEVMQGTTVLVKDVTTDPRIQYRREAKKEGITSILSIPVFLHQETIGVMRLYTKDPHDFSKDEVEFASSIANLGAIAIENAKLYESLRSSYEEIRQGVLSWYDILLDKPRPTSFGHPSEAEFARILDFYHILWVYEPRSFPITWDNGNVTEMFTPDFYLPTLDMYIELTTMRQNLVTDKNRKVRRLKELYPNVNIRLVYRKDYFRLLARYGYGPLKEAEMSRIDKVLFTAFEIEERVTQLGEQITLDYKDRQPVFVGVLKGVMCFISDLIRHVSLPVTVDYMAISPYRTETPGSVAIAKDLEISITGRDVILVEDIIDTGLTLNYLLSYLGTKKPASIKVCTLLDKRARRLINVPVDYVGFGIPDEFVIGYGLDYDEIYRNLPFIAVLKTEDSLSGAW
ncbi:MAG: hypoxanthine phosphoribosyltransferase [Dehalococcoidia bacterium]|nr:hypoxanthine phosphoribosyltransferase [Dehalococcoidia bacterium]